MTTKNPIINRVSINDIRSGSIVIVSGCFGTFPSEIVDVDYVEENIKNGRPGIAYGDRWAYLDQVHSVVKY